MALHHSRPSLTGIIDCIEFRCSYFPVCIHVCWVNVSKLHFLEINRHAIKFPREGRVSMNMGGGVEFHIRESVPVAV